MQLRTAPRILLLPAVALLAACETYRTEYHRRPAYHQQAALGELADRVTLDDGTTLVFRTTEPRKVRRSAQGGDSERARFQSREEHEDGSVTLRGIIPEHVLSNLLTCLHNEEYELIWEQLLSDHTKRAWLQEDQTLDDFVEFFRTHRGQMIQAVNRIYLGLSSFETIMEHDEHGVIEVRLRHSGARGLRFSRVRLIPEGPGLKLVNVR